MLKAESVSSVNDFLDLCKEHNLRLRWVHRREEGEPIAVSINGKYEIFEGYFDSYGIAITADNSRENTHLIKKLKKMGCTPTQEGDTEANLKVEKSRILPIIELLKIKKNGRGKAFRKAA